MPVAAPVVVPISAAIPGAAVDAPTAPAPLQPVPGLNWDGDWPLLATLLPLRGVVQQLALQTEMLKCEHDSDGTRFHLRVPIETLCSPTNLDKMTAALSEHFGRPVRVVTEIGAVRHTASALAQAAREERQRQAEEAVRNDPFVQAMMREFGASIVPGSIKPAN